VDTSVSIGLPGGTINVRDHICAFYRGDDERDKVLLPYLKAGLAAGDRCVAVLDRSDPDDYRERIGDDERLTLLRSEESYLISGGFSPDAMLAFWNETAKVAFDEDGFDFFRAAGEMTWALRDLPGVEHLVAYEAELNRFLQKYPQTLLCLYDLERFTDGEVLIDILRTHPTVMMSGTIVENPWYVEPDEFLAQKAT
jgi:hypothetical protein